MLTEVFHYIIFFVDIQDILLQPGSDGFVNHKHLIL